MDVIWCHCTANDHRLSRLTDLPQPVARKLGYPPTQNLVAILRDPHEVILDIEHCVRACTILDHPFILAGGGSKLIA
jgi:hypothetical protein